ncbi:LamG-like jellyroll fold domain-containing protein [Asinibacterium sp. OR53]|uniref:LamG-like jellyroll fold domain-containing protein n=1 Tax=Asinibacterium sp. OR53 TaxID=925409 RepID=UPI00047EB1ED|nr:LamG-like jellyroll fold domain-containing protein [Asinibacterium sp. OR53]
MKYINRQLLFSLIAGSSMLLSSCYKKFDPSSYAPALSIGGYTSAKSIAPGNLVGYWSFDNNVTDSVTNTAGTNVGVGFVNGIKGAAMQGGVNKYVLFNPGSGIQNLQSFTVTSWVNSPQNTNGIAGILDIANTNSFWGNLTIFFENGGTATNANLKVHVNNNGKDAWLGNYNITNAWNVWMNIAVSYDAASSTFKVFVNGSKIATQVVANFGPLQFQNATKMVFGTVQFQTTPSLTSATSSQPWASFMTGQLDEVRIYNKALAESDINALVKLEGRGK